ncbi:MAG: hypothetical protein IR164_07680 [Devosia sp.]|uniref:hypothetical protein n=1 Tax=Devosia sp. TaxID=1871048 RepID=UPI0019F036EE|nr:hypothetical protein [Devosia sp.]MBF0678802.1 hypothetical protein [Devosia sp.]
MMFGRSSARRRRLLDEHRYERAIEEIERGEQRKGIWAKALAQANFDAGKAKALYLKLRVQAMADEEQESSPTVAMTPPPPPQRVSLPDRELAELRSEASSRVGRYFRAFLWIALGVFLFHTVNYLFFGVVPLINPISWMESATYLLNGMPYLGLYNLVSLVMFGLLGYCVYRAVRAIRAR